MAPSKLPSVPEIKASARLISPLWARYPAGIIATSLGNGKNELSKNIITNIPAYPQLLTLETIKSIMSCNIFTPKFILK